MKVKKTEPAGGGKRDPLAATIKNTAAALDALEVYCTEHKTKDSFDILSRSHARRHLRTALEHLQAIQNEAQTTP